MKFRLFLSAVSFSLALFFSLAWNLVLNLMVVPTASAVEVTDLYQAKVLATGQQSDVVLKKAMAEVLVKVGGQLDVVKQPLLAQALRKPRSYLIRFRYQTEQQQSFLIADFDANKINNLFKQADLAIWGNLRPQVLVWLVVQENGERQVLADSTATDPHNMAMLEQIKQFSAERGLPMLLPLMDLTDATEVDYLDLWARFAKPITAFSARYRPEATVVIRVSDYIAPEPIPAQIAELATELEANKTSSQLNANQASEAANVDSLVVDNRGCVVCQQEWQMDWSFIGQQQRFSQSYRGSDQQQLLAEVLNDITDDIYQHYAATTNAEQKVLLDVANVSDLKQYMNITEFLQSLSSVQSVTLVSASGQQRRFEVDIIGSKKALLAALKLNQQLRQYIDPLAPYRPEQVPVFIWSAQ